MRYFCLTERPIRWPVPGFMEVVSTAPAGSRVVNLAKKYPELARRGQTLGVYATLFGVRRLLQDSWSGQEPPADQALVGIAHHDRFAVTRRVGTVKGPYQLVPPEDLKRLPDEAFCPPRAAVLFPAPIALPVSALGDHHARYSVRDLLHFMAVAIELGVVSDHVVSASLGQAVAVPSCSVGVYPAAWLVQVLELIEQVVDRYESTVAVPREGRRQSGLGACCELLHSMLLERLIEALPPQQTMAGPPVLVAPGTSSIRAAG